MIARHFQQGEGARHIVAVVFAGIADGFADFDEGRKVQHSVEFVEGQGGLHIAPVGQVNIAGESPAGEAAPVADAAAATAAAKEAVERVGTGEGGVS